MNIKKDEDRRCRALSLLMKQRKSGILRPDKYKFYVNLTGFLVLFKSVESGLFQTMLKNRLRIE
ncbi:hypothetical protein BO223_08290 [Faecalibaculum rodentium]|uniref:Uncharacterized protein n=1 Tax=Faecalibaculum rodentium TaxID=1702221 RepID=A0A1Q9YJ66_9FIRM|nr:hypothetical protein BO223_08290 [Faecalibaculum rodentium]